MNPIAILEDGFTRIEITSDAGPKENILESNRPLLLRIVFPEGNHVFPIFDPRLKERMIDLATDYYGINKKVDEILKILKKE